MNQSARLGGFKVLKDVVRISLPSSHGENFAPTLFFTSIAEHHINLPYIAILKTEKGWAANLAVEEIDRSKLLQVIDKTQDNFLFQDNCSVLSIFPHRKNPGITASLFDIFGRRKIELDALANSPSALSAILSADSFNIAGNALFEPFSFSSYRTPEDWKLAQKGKEQLYKEVVASYQEQKPKVYGLECYRAQELIKIESESKKLGEMSALFKELSQMSTHLTFLATTPPDQDGKSVLSFCVPRMDIGSYADVIEKSSITPVLHDISAVSVFSMNGPHFGDRFGIVSELLKALDDQSISLLGLNCTIASITGVAPADQVDSAIETIQQCFEVPTVVEKK